MAARSVWCRGSAVRLAPASRLNRSASSPRICSTDSARSRTAASSIASGMPSRRRQSSATGAMLSSSSTKSGTLAPALAAKSCTDSLVNRLSAGSSPGTCSGGTGTTCS